MSSYRCVVCGSADPMAFRNCKHPYCPDGDGMPPLEPMTRNDRIVSTIFWIAVALIYGGAVGLMVWAFHG